MAPLQWASVGKGRIAISNRPKLKEVAELAVQGCQRIVTIQGRNEMPLQVELAARKAEMAWTWVGVGHGSVPEGEADRAMRRGVLEIVAALEAGESVFVHCSAGIHRTGMMVFAVLRWHGFTEPEALETISQIRTVTRESIWADHILWGNRLVLDAGRG